MTVRCMKAAVLLQSMAECPCHVRARQDKQQPRDRIRFHKSSPGKQTAGLVLRMVERLTADDSKSSTKVSPGDPSAFYS